jgi:hypothetical protein
LQRLENDALELEPTRKIKRPTARSGQAQRKSEARDPASARSSADARGKRGNRSLDETINVSAEIDYNAGGGGFDPYNRS